MFKSSTIAILISTLLPVGFAQMRGSGGTMGQGSPGMSGISGSIAGTNSMASGPVVGPDGTAYVLRGTTGKTELVAINPSNGKVNWALTIDGTMISDPVLVKDGTIVLTTSEPNMQAAGASSRKPALVIVAPAASSARVQARVDIDADMLSAPVTTPDGQTIYVIATDMPAMPVRGQTASGGGSTYLYGFGPGTGNQKFKVQLR